MLQLKQNVSSGKQKKRKTSRVTKKHMQGISYFISNSKHITTAACRNSFTWSTTHQQGFSAVVSSLMVDFFLLITWSSYSIYIHGANRKVWDASHWQSLLAGEMSSLVYSAWCHMLGCPQQKHSRLRCVTSPRNASNLISSGGILLFSKQFNQTPFRPLQESPSQQGKRHRASWKHPSKYA